MRPENDPFFLECAAISFRPPVHIRTEEDNDEWKSHRILVGRYGNISADKLGLPYIDVWKHKNRDQYSVRIMLQNEEMYGADLDQMPSNPDDMFAHKAPWLFENK